MCLHLLLLLTTRGIPQLFYGNEVQMSNKGTEDHGVIRFCFAKSAATLEQALERLIKL